MTTTDLIKLLEKYEKTASLRSREISIEINGEFISEPEITVLSFGNGCVGAELTLKIINIG